MVIGERRQVHLPDIVNGPDVPPSLRLARRSRRATFRSLITPMVWEGQGIGMITVAREPNVGFNDKELGLLRTFADQAVIAIQNARLFNETKEALEQQTATAEVLKAISRTTFELEPVLDALIENATRLCKSDRGFVFIREGDEFRPTASYGATPEQLEFMRRRHLTSTSGTLVGRVAVTRQVVQIEDARTDPEYAWEDSLELLGFRTMLGVPMLREGEPIGVVAIWRDQVRAVLRARPAAGDQLRRPGGDRHRERAPVPRDPGQEPPARDRQPAQERVPGQHEPRTAHAVERHHRLLGGAARTHVRRAERASRTTT